MPDDTKSIKLVPMKSRKHYLIMESLPKSVAWEPPTFWHGYETAYEFSGVLDLPGVFAPDDAAAADVNAILYDSTAVKSMCRYGRSGVRMRKATRAANDE